MSAKTFRKSDGGGMCGNSWRDRGLLIARALSNRDWEKPKDIQRARHMAHKGATAAEISEALGWGVTVKCASRRLKKYNIKPFNPSDCRHRGIETGFPQSAQVGMQRFRPRVLEGR